MTETNSIPPIDRGSFFERDGFLGRFLARRLAPADAAWARPKLEVMGKIAAEQLQDLAWTADRFGPQHVPYDHRGERVDRVVYHEAYRRMEAVAYGQGIVAVKYDPANRKAHPQALHATGFGLGYLFGMAECGLFCPVCMTDGAARVLEHAGGYADDVRRLGAPFATPAERCTGAMFLTEKQAGSDVGACTTVAKQTPEGWRLTGEKWFCSNADAERALVLARPEGAVAGTRGLGMFLLRKEENDPRTLRLDRIKDKLGVRSMPTGEFTLQGARVHEVGAIDTGFKQMTEMLNLSRLYNAVASCGLAARAVADAWSHSRARRTFGRAVADHAIAREVLLELDAERAGMLALTFEGVCALDRADSPTYLGGKPDEVAKKLVRSLTPLAKLFTGKVAVACVSEALELHGGNGYIEDSSLPRLLRDAQVLPIWEGTTNVLTLDLVRASRTEAGHEALLTRAADALGSSTLSSLGDARDRTARRLARVRDELAALVKDPKGEVPGTARETAYLLGRTLETALLLEAAEREGPSSPEADAANRLSKKDRSPSL